MVVIRDKAGRIVIKFNWKLWRSADVSAVLWDLTQELAASGRARRR